MITKISQHMTKIESDLNNFIQYRIALKVLDQVRDVEESIT